MRTIESLHELISNARLHQGYFVKDYIAYCSEIRHSCWNKPDISTATIKFLEKYFVDEMKPLAKICDYLYGKNEKTIRVQYANLDPPDGKIFVPSGQNVQEICIEFTTAADKRKLNFAVELMRKGVPTILTGYAGTDISGSRNKGYCVKSIPVDENSLFGEAEFEEEAITDQESKIKQAVNRKLENNWLNRKNWLCILIDDITHWNDRIELMMNPVLQEICHTYKNQLRSNYIEQLWFIGYKSYISNHSLEQVL